jgi:patatin-like phospholipase/acyl hydrolase
MDKIFSVSWKRRLMTFNGILAPIYEKTKLYEACGSIIKNCAISDLDRNLLIWSYDLVNQKPYLYMNVKHLNPDYNKVKYSYPAQYLGYLHDAVFYSCLAPTYFNSDSGLTDGGIFANNPAAISLVTLYRHDETLFQRGVMLSIGYDGKPERLKIDGGSFTWLQASKTLMEANTSQGKYITENVLDDRFFRVEVQTKVGLDAVNEKAQLKLDAQKWVDENLDILLAWVDKYFFND